MKQTTNTKKRMARLVVWGLVILAVLVTAHVLFNYLDVAEMLKAIHGG